MISVMDWIGLDSERFELIQLNWIGLDWNDSIRTDWIGLDWNDSIRTDWIRLDSIKLD